MSYTLATLWHDRQRYLPGILAVAFSALLIALQCGLLFGLLSISTIPIDRSDADVWIGMALNALLLRGLFIILWAGILALAISLVHRAGVHEEEGDDDVVKAP